MELTTSSIYPNIMDVLVVSFVFSMYEKCYASGNQCTNGSNRNNHFIHLYLVCAV